MMDCTCNNNYACPTTEVAPVCKSIGNCIESVVYCTIVFFNIKADPLHILVPAAGFLGTVVVEFHALLH